LIAAGADTNAGLRGKPTALEWVGQRGSVPVLTAVIPAGAPQNVLKAARFALSAFDLEWPGTDGR
jgi:hypothetical protein